MDEKKLNTTSSRFGLKGWNVIIMIGFLLLISSGVSNDGLNISLGGLAAKNGWEQGMLLTYTSYATLISVILIFIIAKICDKVDARKIAFISLVIAGACYIWYGCAPSISQLLIAFCLANTFAYTAAWSAGGIYMAMWFPRKKGLAMGWATMGNNVCTAAFVPILNALAVAFGITKAIVIIGIVIILASLWALATKARPEQAGATPDNIEMSAEEIEAYRQEVDAYVSDWTLGRLIKTKEFWGVSLCLCCTFLSTVGIISQLVSRLVAGFGMTQNFAVTCMSICAIIGILGSYIWGVIDQKIGTKKAVVIYMLWYAIAIVFNLIPGGNITLWISIIMIGFALGGNANWPVSFTSSVFGYKNFSRVYPYINLLMNVGRAIAFLVLGISLTVTGSLEGAYVVFIVILLVGMLCAMIVNDKKYANGYVAK